MAIGTGLFTGLLGGLYDPLFIVVHLVTALVGFYFANKAMNAGRTNQAYGFTLYGIGSGLSYIFVHTGHLAGGFVHVTESVLVFLAIIFIGLEYVQG